MTPRLKSFVVRSYLKSLARSTKPIVLGPWRSECGFEQLYWIPFLHWALPYAGISPDRCIALSRGGMGRLYPAAQHADLYTLRGVDAVRLENEIDRRERGIQKQTSVTAWDRDVAHEAAGRTSYHLLHPSWMYWLFEDYWEERVGMRHVAAHCRFEALPVPSLPEGFGLPEKFMAVRFYERATFPMTPEVQGIVRDLVGTLAARRPVVLLNQRGHFDDHADLSLSGPNILQLPQVPPEQNFLLQAAVLARCTAFVGTYGGVAQWALRYRKPSLSAFVQFGGTAVAHWSLSRHLANTWGVPFDVLDLKAVKLYELVLSKAEEAVAA